MPVNFPCGLAPTDEVTEDFVSQILSPIFYSRPPDGYEVIFMDPPWPSKSNNRARHYRGAPQNRKSCRMPLLESLSIRKLVNADRGIVGVWVTNNRRLVNYVASDLMQEKWGCELIGTMVWVKVTTKGELVCPPDSMVRKPYECMIVGRLRCQSSTPQVVEKHEKNEASACRADDTGGDSGDYHFPQPFVFVFRVPTRHSNKPASNEIVKNILPMFMQISDSQSGGSGASGGSIPKNVEFFARSLSPGFISIGNEVLKFNLLLKGID
eukprot:Selendium_serpulae@DN6137_c0_g1_i2.p1